MKKRFPIILLSFVVFVGAAWYFALAAPEKKLAIGEVPAGLSGEQYVHHTFKIGDVAFSMPMYFGVGAELRNVYNGECLRKVDGECKAYHFEVRLKIPDKGYSQQSQIDEINQSHVCKNPEEFERGVGVPYHEIGDICDYAFVYENLIVWVTFRTSPFPKESVPTIEQHITAFLNHFRISSTGE